MDSQAAISDLIAQYLSASAVERTRSHRSVMKSLVHHAEAHPIESLSWLSQLYDPMWDFPQQQQTYKAYQSILGKFDDTTAVPLRPLRIAVLGSGTLTQLTWVLELNLVGMGFHPQVYSGEYGLYRQEIFDINSELYHFEPQVLFLLTSSRDVSHINFEAPRASVAAHVQQEFDNWMMLWETFRQRTNAVIVQNNFDIPDTRLLGNMEARVPGSQSAVLQTLNAYMVDHLPDYVLLHDLEYLSSYYGKRQFFDPRFYHYSKQVCSFEVLPAYAASLSSIMRANSGLGYKCLVLDLDNTVWGGVIGDDGLDHIVIGEGKPAGEAYLALQQYAKQLKNRGILLAVCSKNDETIAREPFLTHPDMVLRVDDIACFIANWDPKPDNLRRIAQELNIGLDSLVFVDDNPAERAIVRQMLPQVTVVELPEDPSLYVRALVEGHYFEAVTFSEEDRFRTDFYLENRNRDQLAHEITDVADFLSALNMVATISPFNEIDLDRITQLISRSNQFNLTTRRYNRADLATLMQDPRYVTRSTRLKDKFGDNGLIAVWIGQVVNDGLDIDTWLMSCRVLGRGVEQHLLNHIISYAQEHGIRWIRGTYIPTSKNALVREHYAKLGFKLISDDAGTTNWELPIEPDTTLITTAIHDA